MAAKDFPASPVAGQVFENWVWNDTNESWDSLYNGTPPATLQVAKYASVAARTTAIPTPAEGMITYLDDVNQFQGYADTAWATINLQGTAGVPYTQAAGQVTITLSTSSAGATTTVTFPASRFSVTPLVQVSKTTGGLAKYIAYTTGGTASGTTVGIYSGDGSATTGNVVIAWLATQMTSSAAVG